MIRLTFMLLFALVIVGCQRAPEITAPPVSDASDPQLPSSAVSVSGLSSGAYMATQMHIAHSERITGVGLIAGGPYGCSQGSIQRALTACTAGGELDVAALAARASALERDGAIDPLKYLETARVWIFHGAEDAIVASEVSAAARSFYSVFVAAAQSAFVVDVPAAHGFPVIDSELACNSVGTPFLNSCNYDAAGALLTFVTNADADITAAAAATGRISAFDQPELTGSGLAETGLVYTPEQCTNRRCDVHIAFHGCSQGSEFIGERFAREAGYNRWADALDLVIIYPQVAANPLLNPLGCWDWWGYTGKQFDTQRGAQMQAVIRVLDGFMQALP